MQPKDQLNNDLEIGDLVQVQLGSPFQFARVVGFSPGGVVVPGGQKGGRHMEDVVTLGNVIVRMEITAQFHPGNGMAGALLKVADPQPELAEQVRAEVKSAGKRGGKIHEA